MNLGRIKDFNRYVYIAWRRGPALSGVEPKHIIYCKLILRKKSIFLSKIDTHFFAWKILLIKFEMFLYGDQKKSIFYKYNHTFLWESKCGIGELWKINGFSWKTKK